MQSTNGLVYALPAYDSEHDLITKEFNHKYREKFGQESDLFAGNGYDSIYIISKAIENSSYAASDIRKALFEIKDFTGVTGRTTFDKYGDVIKSVSIKKIFNGEFLYFN